MAAFQSGGNTMIALDTLKSPKNAVGWIILGFVLACAGYFLLLKNYEWLGRILGALGVLALLVVLVRLAVTHIILGVIVIALVAGYIWWYVGAVSVKETSDQAVYEHEPWIQYDNVRRRPQYADTALGSYAEWFFAPAWITESLVLFPKWKTDTEVKRVPYTPTVK